MEIIMSRHFIPVFIFPLWFGMILCQAVEIVPATTLISEVPAVAEVSAIDWPLITPTTGGELRLYHPSVETFKGNSITARAAFSITSEGQAQPTFGVVWLAARANTDRETRTISLSDQTVTKVHLPGASDQEEAAISTVVTRLIKGLDPVISLDRILASLSDVESEHESAEGLNTTPPKIIVVNYDAMLLYFDGAPLGAAITGSQFERIENTPFQVYRDTGKGIFWLYHEKNWYSTPDIARPWTLLSPLSPDLVSLTPLLKDQGDENTAENQETIKQESGNKKGSQIDAPLTPLSIIVSLEPAELISMDGPAAYEPILNTSLLAVTNSDSDLFMETTTQQHYLLLAGRWFRTPDLAHGPWQFVTPGALPQDFARIPPNSPYGHILVHVPGTSIAEEAVLDALVPQTAAVKRDASITVNYEGNAEWQPITSMNLAYAVNTPQAVFKESENNYYACEQGVWYHASFPAGPWTAATSIPADIKTISPDNPHYNVRYVHIYDATPQYIYVGYSSGYLGSYISHGTVVWGTGYHYRGGWHQRFYPRPLTWGFRMSYNHWNGHWGVGVHHAFGGYYNGYGVRVTQGGWWGPAGYQRMLIQRNQVDYAYRNRTVEQQRSQAQLLARESVNQNLYRRPENRDRTLSATISKPRALPAVPRQASPPVTAGEPERIIAGHDGEVFRKNHEGWQQWQRDGWKGVSTEAHDPTPIKPPNKPTTGNTPAAPNDHRALVPPAPNKDPPPPANTNPPVQPPHHEEVPQRPRQNDDEQSKKPSAPKDVVRPPPLSRADQLERQQRFDERGIERSQQFQKYRATKPEIPSKNAKTKAPAKESVPKP
jgi:hypothetical protein